MSASDEFTAFLNTVEETVDIGPVLFKVTLSDANKRAILEKFEELRSDVIREHEATEAESRRDGRRDH